MSDWAILKDLKERSANAYLLGTGPKKLWTKKHVAKTNNRHILWLFFRGNLKFSKRSRFRNKLSKPSDVAPPVLCRKHPPELAPQPMASRRIKAPFFSAPWFVEISMMPLHQKTTKVIGSKKTLGSISSCVFFVHPSKAIPSVPGAWFCCWLSIRENIGHNQLSLNIKLSRFNMPEPENS